MSRPPARTALGVGGLLGGLDVGTRSHLAPDHPVSFSLDVLPTREDPWDRGAIVRGFWACPDFGWRPLKVRMTPGAVDFGCMWIAMGGDTRAVDVADGSAVS